MFKLKVSALNKVSPKKGALLTIKTLFALKLANGKFLKRLKSVSLKLMVAFTELLMVLETICTILSLNKNGIAINAIRNTKSIETPHFKILFTTDFFSLLFSIIQFHVYYNAKIPHLQRYFSLNDVKSNSNKILLKGDVFYDFRFIFMAIVSQITTKTIAVNSIPPAGSVINENQNKEKTALLPSLIDSPKSSHNHFQEKAIIIGKNIIRSTNKAFLKIFK
jgi:hypothetical protein